MEDLVFRIQVGPRILEQDKGTIETLASSIYRRRLAVLRSNEESKC